MLVQQVVCDVCGRTKGEGNKWFQPLMLQSKGHSAVLIGDEQITERLQLNKEGAFSYHSMDICGEQCLATLILGGHSVRG